MNFARLVLLGLAVSACGGDEAPQSAPSAVPPPELETPVAVNADAPVSYPPALYDQRIEGDVLLRLYVDSWRWHGVPFVVRAGKRLATTCTEVLVELRVPPPVVFVEPMPARGNYLRLRLSPRVAIAVGLGLGA